MSWRETFGLPALEAMTARACRPVVSGWGAGPEVRGRCRISRRPPERKTKRAGRRDDHPCEPAGVFRRGARERGPDFLLGCHGQKEETTLRVYEQTRAFALPQTQTCTALDVIPSVEPVEPVELVERAPHENLQPTKPRGGQRMKFWTERMDYLREFSRDHRVLHIGPGHDERFGTTMDINPNVKPDVLHNLNELPYPFETNSFDAVYAFSVIEHLDDFFAVMTEMHRILRPGGFFSLLTPHFSDAASFRRPEPSPSFVGE